MVLLSVTTMLSSVKPVLRRAYRIGVQGSRYDDIKGSSSMMRRSQSNRCRQFSCFPTPHARCHSVRHRLGSGLHVRILISSRD